MPRPRTRLSAAARATEVDSRLERVFPGSAIELCALVHRNAFELLVATVLSAQTTDEQVNAVTPALFSRYPDARALAGADSATLEAMLRPVGFFRSKSDHLLGLARLLVERYNAEVPTALADLVTLPGVGRKTANVVRSVGFGLPGLPVDTHVLRLSRRLDLTRAVGPVAVEAALCRVLPAPRWGGFSLRLIAHGRRTCTARAPRCAECVLVDLCPQRGVTPTAAPLRGATSP